MISIKNIISLMTPFNPAEFLFWNIKRFQHYNFPSIATSPQQNKHIRVNTSPTWCRIRKYIPPTLKILRSWMFEMVQMADAETSWHFARQSGKRIRKTMLFFIVDFSLVLALSLLFACLDDDPNVGDYDDDNR